MSTQENVMNCEVYPCNGDGQAVKAVAMHSARHWHNLCQADLEQEQASGNVVKVRYLDLDANYRNWRDPS